jgi:hypothetical protein
MITGTKPKISNTSEYQFDISALNDSSIIILGYLDPFGLLALSRTGQKNRKLFNNKNLLNHLREIYNDSMPSISFIDGNRFLNDLVILVECIKTNEQSVRGDNNYKVGDRITLSPGLTDINIKVNRAVGTYLATVLLERGYGNYIVSNIQDKALTLVPVNIYGEILPMIEVGNEQFEYIDGSIISRANLKAAVAKFETQDTIKGKIKDIIVDVIIVHGISTFINHRHVFINKYPSLLIPYADFKYPFKYHLIAERTAVETGIDIYQINKPTTPDHQNTSIMPLNISYIDTTIINKPGAFYAIFIKIKNFLDDTELWRVTNNENNIDIEYKITLGYYAEFIIALLYMNIDNVVKLLTLINPAFGNNRAIIMACEKGDFNIIKLLLEDGRINPSVSNNKPIIAAADTTWGINIIELMLEDFRVNMSLTENILHNQRIKNVLILKIKVQNGIYSLYAIINNESIFAQVLNYGGYYGKFLRHIIRYPTYNNMNKRIKSMIYIVNTAKYTDEHKIIRNASLTVLYPKRIEEITNKLFDEENEENINLYFSIRGYLLLTIFNYNEIVNILTNEGANTKNINMFSYLCAAEFGYNRSIENGVIKPMENILNLNINNFLEILIK